MSRKDLTAALHSAAVLVVLTVLIVFAHWSVVFAFSFGLWVANLGM